MAGDVAVHKIGYAGQNKDREGEIHVEGEAEIEQNQEHRDQRHPEHGQLIGGIHCFTPLSRR